MLWHAKFSSIEFTQRLFYTWFWNICASNWQTYWHMRQISYCARAMVKVKTKENYWNLLSIGPGIIVTLTLLEILSCFAGLSLSLSISPSTSSWTLCTSLDFYVHISWYVDAHLCLSLDISLHIFLHVSAYTSPSTSP